MSSAGDGFEHLVVDGFMAFAFLFAREHGPENLLAISRTNSGLWYVPSTKGARVARADSKGAKTSKRYQPDVLAWTPC